MSAAFPMRRRVFRGSHERGVALLAEAPFIHLATTTEAGVPVLRTVNAVVDEDIVAFHGAPAGEKLACVGRAAVIGADDHVAQIPSYFTDPERACPATTFYRSVQVHGVLTKIDDPVRKARVLSRLMAKHQPEGRHVPLTADHPLYQKEIAAILVVGVSLEQLDLKEKLGQNRTPAEVTQLLEGLWRRGQRGDLRALELVRERNPDAAPPDALRAPVGYRIEVAEGTGSTRAEEAARLLEGVYWLPGISTADIATSHRASNAWVGVCTEAGELVASARAISDYERSAWIYDVVVVSAHRRRGLGKLLVEVLLAHPAVRAVRNVRLGTRDAQGLYERYGFVVSGKAPSGVLEMIRRREPAGDDQNGTGPVSVQR